MKFQDITGLKFGLLTVKADDRGQGTNPRVSCICDCGKEAFVSKGNLKAGLVRSCGCIRRKHGLSKTRLWNCWRKHRRNGTLCEQWSSSCASMYKFFGKDDIWVNPIDRSKPVGPDNYILSTLKGSPRLVEVDGEVRSLSGWATFLKISRERARQIHDDKRLEYRVRKKKEELDGFDS